MVHATRNDIAAWLVSVFRIARTGSHRNRIERNDRSTDRAGRRPHTAAGADGLRAKRSLGERTRTDKDCGEMDRPMNSVPVRYTGPLGAGRGGV